MVLLIILVVFLGIAAALAWYLIAHDKGEKEPIGALWIAAGFGVLGAVAAFLLESKLIPARDLVGGAPLLMLLAASLGIGVIEEACKFLPLSLFIYPKRYFNEHTDGVIYFAIAGLGFGVPENMLYTLQFGAKVGLARIILTPLFHAATTAMVGYYLAKSKLRRKSRILSWPALAVAMALHGLYDFGLASGVALFTILSITITLLMSAGLFVFYNKATELDQEMGLSVVGNNSFCRSCGAPNPKHNLYCSRCGNRA